MSERVVVTLLATKLLLNRLSPLIHIFLVSSLHAAARMTNRDELRSAVGMAIVDLAASGHSDRAHLANYAAYRGRMFIDLKH